MEFSQPEFSFLESGGVQPMVCVDVTTTAAMLSPPLLVNVISEPFAPLEAEG